MKNKKISNSIFIMAILFFAISIFFVSCSNPGPKKEIIDLDNVKSIKSITMKKELNRVDTGVSFIPQIHDICQGFNGTYYVDDIHTNRILQFSKDDELLNIIGRQGEGPGEFIDPSCMKYYDNGEAGKLYVLDNGGTRLQMFDVNGKYTDTKSKIEISAQFFDIDNDGNIIVPMRTDIEYLLTKFSPTGEVLQKIIPIDKNDELLFKDEIKVFQRFGEVVYDKKNNLYWIFFTFSPDIRIYNSNGDLIKEIQFASKSIDTIKQRAEERQKNLDPRVQIRHAFQRNAKLLPNGNIYVYLPGIANIELNYKNNNIHVTKYETKDLTDKIEKDYILSFINGKYYGYGYMFKSFFRE